MKFDLRMLTWFRGMRYQHWIATLAVLLMLFDTFIKPISVVSLGAADSRSWLSYRRGGAKFQ